MLNLYFKSFLCNVSWSGIDLSQQQDDMNFKCWPAVSADNVTFISNTGPTLY